MPSKSSSTYITAAVAADGDVLKAAEATREVAAGRLGGSDGLQVEALNRLDGGMIGVTWQRSWEEAVAETEQPSPT